MGAVEGSRVLATGGAGFSGRRVVSALAERGAGVCVADPREVNAGGVTSLAGDLREPAAARAVAPGTDVIVAPGYQTSHDLTSGIATVWPEWAPAGTGAAAADGKAAL